jgi:hypothetical protein
MASNKTEVRTAIIEQCGQQSRHGKPTCQIWKGTNYLVGKKGRNYIKTFAILATRMVRKA